MRPAWLIEPGVYGAEADPLLAEIRRQGRDAEAVPFQTILKGKDVVADGRPLADGDCVIGHHVPLRPGDPAALPLDAGCVVLAAEVDAGENGRMNMAAAWSKLEE
jgi:hypothetical protein